MTYGEAIAKQLESICHEKGITINKLSTISGITQSTLDNIVKGHTHNPKLKTLHHVAVGLGMTVSEFLDFYEMNELEFENE